MPNAKGIYPKVLSLLLTSIVLVLADSGFCKEGFLKHLETAGRRYIIAMRLSDYVQSAIRQIETWAPLNTDIEMAEATVRLST